MTSPPIGILTRDRAPYLDVTLRSLTATRLPDDVSVRIFDDASTCELTRAYYATSGHVRLSYTWPVGPRWQTLGFDVLPGKHRRSDTIGSKVTIQRNTSPLGVVVASCKAVRQLFDSTDADGVFLLQDDVVFNADWYERMLDTVSIKLNHKLKPGERIAAPSGITAQCLYISRRAFDKVEFLRKPPAVKQRFDDLLRRSMVTAGLWGGVIYPFVCQHIGVQSLVRPHKRWTASSTARVGYYAHPPYTMSDSVRVFRG